MSQEAFGERFTATHESEFKIKSDCMTVDEMRELYDSFPDTQEELKRLYPPVPFPRKDNVG